ncbi:HAMP domain-containing sensor histidine kinase [Neobacillus drentensis]
MESEKRYQDLAKNYEAVESLNQNLEKRIQEETVKSREKDFVLIQQSRLAAMGEMITSMGHQWREPLNSLSLLIQDVKEALEFGEIDDQYIDRFIRDGMLQIKRMSRTINDFRDFYQPNEEKIPFSVGEAIEDALSIFISNLNVHGIQVDFEYRGQSMAFGFPNEYSQVVLNLLTNTRDAFVQMDINQRNIVIHIAETGDEITAEFIDNAGGIEPAFLEKIFDPYFTTRHHGTGLGLYMAKKIIENMDGSVTVENCVDGAKFSLMIPKLNTSVNSELIAVQ